MVVQACNLEYITRGIGTSLKVDKEHEKDVLDVLKHFPMREIYFGVANKEFLSAGSSLAFEAKYIRKDQPAAPGCSLTGIFIPYQVVQLYPNMKILEIESVHEKIKPMKKQESVKFKLQINDESMYGLEVFLKPQKSKKR